MHSGLTLVVLQRPVGKEGVVLRSRTPLVPREFIDYTTSMITD